jgi:hypothetical protein
MSEIPHRITNYPQTLYPRLMCGAASFRVQVRERKGMTMRPRLLIGGSGIAAAVLLGATLLAGGGSFSRGADSAAAAVTAGPTNTSRPTILGTAKDGETLTASNGTWTGGTSITFAYQWQRCDEKGAACVDISGATNNTYTLTSADVGATVAIAVTATDSGGSSTAYSDLAGPVAPKGSAPAYTTQPSINGTVKEGATLTVDKGVWAGSTPITYTYQWMRCDSAGKNCSLIGGPTTSTKYTLTSADVGHTIIVGVIAKNSFGTQTGFTKPTSVVVATKSLVPAYTTKPAITGLVRVGQVLTVSNGSWSGATPMTFSYQWQRCDSAGKNCGVIAGATRNVYQLTAADAGHVVLAAVTAKNAYGSQIGFTDPTSVVPAAVAPGAAVSVQSVALPNRLVISGVAFNPRRVTPRTTSFTARFRVTDSNGHPVSGALVYAIALPYGRVSNAAEVQTDANGYATIGFRPLHRVAARRHYVVFFVRARKPGDSLLAGVSTRRLVQVTTGS